VKYIITLLSLLLAGFSGTGFAASDTADIDFSGSVPQSCTFGLKTNGLLTNSGSGTLTTGTAGTVPIVCNTVGSTLKIAAPTPTPGSVAATADSLSSTATLTGANIGTITSGGTTTITLASQSTVGSPTEVTVGMTADFNTTYGTNIPGGNYNYTVTLTLTP
jgi:hypothetical protein